MSSENSTAKLFKLILLLFSVLPVAAQTTGNWTQQMPQTSPPGRDSQGMAYDSGHSQVVLFGGLNANGSFFADTWVWDGQNWSQKSSAASPSARVNPGMAYDAMRQKTVLFGGGPALSNDTWVWDGTSWSQMTPATKPPVRYGVGMAYDSAHGQTVLFGGESLAVQVLNDTWVWDGTNWTQKSPANNPPPRCFQAMVYDSAHGQVVLFGGHSNNTGNDFSDTWVWDGTNWTQASPQNSPPARQFPSMAFDSTHGQVVMFGGFASAGSTILGDTWTWDGKNWTQQSPAVTPPPSNAPAMAYDPKHDQTVLFGGYSGSYSANTWTFAETTTTTGPTIGGVASASAFGDFTTVAPGTWIEIYGSNLAPDTRQWQGSDFNGNNAPTALDGVSVSIGGQSAFVDFISAVQVNAQLPSGIATGGMLPITITNGGVTSPAFNIAVNATEPGLLAPPSFKIGGNQYVVAQFADGTYVLPAGAISGITSRPAKPGEVIVIYGVGFGSVTPSIPAGQIVTQSNQLSLQFQLNFGQTPAQLLYDGLSPNFVGLYQFNVTVPSVPDNNLVPLTLNLGGTAGTQTLFTAVHQ